MSGLIVFFAVLAMLAGILGFSGVVVGAAAVGVLKLLCLIFAVLFIINLFNSTGGGNQGRGTPPSTGRVPR